VGFSKVQLFDTVIIRLGGEIGIKATWTRKLYERRLIKNIKAVLKHYDIPYEALNRKFGRLYIETPEAQKSCQKLTRVFGISSVSPALQTTSKLIEILDKSVQVAGFTFRKRSSFAVRCRRVGKHAYTSQDVCREVGRQLLEKYSKYDLHVDLKSPDATLNIEVREDKAYIFTEVIRGLGGLPLGTQPKAVCLLNEDISSLVTCWMVMKRGCPILPLHFDDIASNRESTNKMLKAAKTLFEWSIGFPTKVYAVSYGQNLAKIEQNSAKELRHVLLKRIMYRVAERIGEMERAEGVVTGESINKGEGKALHLLTLQDEAAKHFPIHRPLLGLEDAEIKELARKIGVCEISSSRKVEKTETPFRASKTIKLKEVKEAEARLNVDEILEALLKSLRTINL